MTTIRVDAVTPTASGKAWRVRSGSRWFNAFKDSGIENHIGKTIDAEISTHEKYGDGIEKYKVVDTPTGPQGTPTNASGAVSGVRPALDSNRGAPWYMPFLSNTVAHAITAGLIKGPTEIKVWVLAAKEAAESVDDIPL